MIFKKNKSLIMYSSEICHYYTTASYLTVGIILWDIRRRSVAISPDIVFIYVLYPSIDHQIRDVYSNTTTKKPELEYE